MQSIADMMKILRRAPRIYRSARAPRETSVRRDRWNAEVPADIGPAWLDRAFDDARGRIIKRHVTAEFAIRHGHHDLADRPRIIRVRRMQKRSDRGTAAEQQGYGKQYDEDR